VEFGCGATLAKWAARGCRIHHLILTDGSKGTWAADDDVAALVDRRQREQRQAADVLAGGGGGDVYFLGWPDGELESGLEQRRQVCQVIRQVRPEVVLGHDPWRRYRLHPDHRNAGWLLTDAVVAARDPKFFPELSEPPHRPTSMLLWEADEPNHVENADGMLEIKLSALLAHKSQYRSTMGIAQTGPSAPGGVDELETFRTVVEEQLSAHGRLAGVAAGEAFRLLTEI
jgi:LmbE family N-acetylglucosaminyl deacetylase